MIAAEEQSGIHLDDYTPLLGGEVDELRALARPLAHREVLMVNSTRVGGGVAELLNRIVPIMEELEMRPRWEVVIGEQEFYEVTKGFHNALHGSPAPLPDRAFDIFRHYTEVNRERLQLDSEFVVMHDPQPAGLIFIGSGAALPPQAIRLFASSKNAIEFQAAASTTDGGGWLSIAPATGSTSAGSPANVMVTANPAGLAPGVYRGSVSFAFTTAVRSVNVTLIVEAGATGASRPASSGANPAPRETTTCTGAQLVPTQTGLVSNFSSPASWPTPLSITLVDTCGNPVGDAQVVATFTNGDPPLALAVVDAPNGLYSGTWTPRNTSSQVTILARASAPGFPAAATVQPSRMQVTTSCQRRRSGRW